MARTPKPWFRKDRGAWYACINGRQHRLHEEEAKARREFYRLMVAEGLVEEVREKAIKVADAAEAMIASSGHLREGTRRLYVDRLGPFAAKFAGRRLDSIRPEEVIAFVSGYEGRHYRNKTFGDSSRSLMFRYIKSLFRWARDVGHIAINPMHGKECPWKIQPRVRVMTEEEYRLIQDCPRITKNFKEVMEFLWRTGARPGEIASVQARHLDARQPIARLQPTEHKTGTKTGLQREVLLPEDLMSRLREYAKARPKGTLLRRRNGSPWTQEGISVTFGRWRRKLGISPDCVIYLARHAFGTRALGKGHSIAMVAKMLGHNDPHTLMKHYFHPEQVAMLDAVNKLDD